MPTNVFIELSEEKRENIIKVSIAEFSKYGYENSSTNRIVQDAGISKGSLFKYFKNKEELFFYILDFVTQKLIVSLAQEVPVLPKGLFERIIRYSELEFTWYVKHPNECKLITTVFTKSDTAIYKKVEAHYSLKGQNVYYKLLEDIDTSMLKWDKKKTVDILKWFLKGFNEDFMTHIQEQDKSDISKLQHEYVKSLSEYITIFKYGLINEKDER
ncbi:MAG: TetR/AcrR family transcriptional regulator [Filifactoraceae bacterium]